MSANNFAQLASSYFWGWASDATGRKPLLLLSNVVSGAASAWFVSTQTFGQGVASRALSGCFMCSGVVMKAMIGLHYTKQGQAIAMAWRTLGAGVGQIATPLIIVRGLFLFKGGGVGFDSVVARHRFFLLSFISLRLRSKRSRKRAQREK